MYHNWVASRKTRKHWFLKEENSPGETRCKKSWDQFEKYGSHSLRYVKQESGKRKAHRMEKYKSKILISEVPTLWNLRIDLTKRLQDNSDVPKARHGTLPKTYKLKENDKATFYSRAEECVLLVTSKKKEPEEREFAVDSGASMHVVSKRDLDSAGLETVRTPGSPTTVMTANGEVQTREEATVFVKELDFLVTVTLLEETPTVLSLGKLCKHHGFSYHWTSGQKPHLTKKARELIAILRTAHHSWSLVCRQVLLLHLHLLLQRLHRRILWVTRRIQQQKEVKLWVKSHGETRRMDQQKPKTQIKMMTTRNYAAIYCKICRYDCRISKRIWWIRMFNHINIHPALLTNYQWSHCNCGSQSSSWRMWVTPQSSICRVVVQDLATQWLQS